jgi:hypothetical protein
MHLTHTTSSLSIAFHSRHAGVFWRLGAEQRQCEPGLCRQGHRYLHRRRCMPDLHGHPSRLGVRRVQHRVPSTRCLSVCPSLCVRLSVRLPSGVSTIGYPAPGVCLPVSLSVRLPAIHPSMPYLHSFKLVTWKEPFYMAMEETLNPKWQWDEMREQEHLGLGFRVANLSPKP